MANIFHDPTRTAYDKPDTTQFRLVVLDQAHLDAERIGRRTHLPNQMKLDNAVRHVAGKGDV